MGRPIDKIDTNKDEAKYNISPSSVIQNIPTKPDYDNAYSQGYINGYLKGKKDQMQQKIGRWIPVDSYSAFGGDEVAWMAHGNPVAFYYCSECKEQAYAGEDGESLLTKYCPNCGAYMRKDGDDIDS